MTLTRHLLSAGCLGTLLASTAAVAETSTTYNRVDEVQDWGTVMTKLIVDAGGPVSGKIDSGSFAVTISRSDPRLEPALLEEGELAIAAAYVSDAEGNPADEGRYITLEPQIGPEVTRVSALNYGVDPVAGRELNAWTENAISITQTAQIEGTPGDLVATQLGTLSRPGIERFEFSETSYQDEEYGAMMLPYAHFEPDTDEGVHPLIVWLHGGGEGGQDPTIPLAANRADSLASDETQQIFSGAYVLVPQSPTRWMHGPEGQQGVNDKQDALSIYTRAVQQLVEDYADARDDIDRDRIYLAGASNGGWLVVRLALDYPKFYAATLPAAEPMNMDHVSDDELQGIIDMPMWLVTAGTDETVQPDTLTVPLYSRLKRLGARDVHLTILPTITDMSGRYEGEDGTPYEYSGHWSWVPTYNNHIALIDGGAGGQLYGRIAAEVADVGGREVTPVLNWLSQQSRSGR